MFENVINFFKKIGKKDQIEEKSKDTAKERLHLVLMQDRAIVVTNAEISSIRDADRIIGLLEASEIKNPELIVNRLRPNMVRKGEMMDVDDIVDLLSINLLGVVPDDEFIITQTNKGEPAVINKKAPSG